MPYSPPRGPHEAPVVRRGARAPAGSGSAPAPTASCRIRFVEGRAGERWRAGTPFIFATWHSRVLLLPALYRGRGLRVLISRSRDGEMIARLCARFHLDVARGSSSRGGAEALRALARALAEGTSVVIGTGWAARAERGGQARPRCPRRAERGGRRPGGGGRFVRVAARLVGRVPRAPPLRALRGPLRRAHHRAAGRRLRCA